MTERERIYNETLALIHHAQALAGGNRSKTLGVLAGALGLAIAWESAEHLTPEEDIQALRQLVAAAQESVAATASRVWCQRGCLELN